MLKRRTPTEAQKGRLPRQRPKIHRHPHAPRTLTGSLVFDPAATKRLAKMVLLEGESPTLFLTLARQLHEELAPQNPIELILSAKLFLAYWR